jgi:2-dehydro-3-deoxyphosphogluconate aldolase/(4S)-4-hydroxy-2-oxoglutarate aldolase
MAARGDILVGASTVLMVAQVDRAVAAGARFVVSSVLARLSLSVAVSLGCWRRLVRLLPVRFRLLLSTVTFFPAETSGHLAAIKALAAPFGGVSFGPMCGVGPGNLAQYLAISAAAAVVGSWMAPRDRIRAGDFDGIRGDHGCCGSGGV